MGALIPRIAAAIGLTVLSLSATSTLARERPQTAVADLRYGTSLYHYHLDDYMAALTELLVAEKRGGITGHGDNPEIMEGGLAMGYTMERYASEIFDRLLEQNRSVEVRDAAWFYLAKMRYAHAEWQRAEEAINRISAEPAQKLVLDANALRINILLKLNKSEEAAQLFSELEVDSNWLPYFNFNLGSAFAREKDYERAIGYFNFLAKEEFKQEEYRALYDKAMTAAGYSYLFEKQYPEAMQKFSMVRLTSALSNRALLGYGWAAAEMGDYTEALKPWKHLAEGALVDENNQEALIAVPYAYEKLGAENLALTHYQKAESIYLDEIQNIDEVIVSLQADNLLEALQIQARGKLDWMSFAKENELSPRLAYLVALFSRNLFQSSIKELQDLLAVRDDLIIWQEKIQFYTDMLVEREFSRSEKANFLQVATLEEQIGTMRTKRAELGASIETIVSDKKYFELANDLEQDLIVRIQRGEVNIEKLKATDPFIDEYEESLRRYKGILLWQSSESYGDKLWHAIKTLNRLDQALVDVTATQQRVDNLMATAPDLDPYRLKMNEANAEISELLQRINNSIERNEGELKGQVLEILEQQRYRLSNYLAQCRLSIARIYDKALSKHIDEEFEEARNSALEQQKLKQQEQEKETKTPANELMLLPDASNEPAPTSSIVEPEDMSTVKPSPEVPASNTNTSEESDAVEPQAESAEASE